MRFGLKLDAKLKLQVGLCVACNQAVAGTYFIAVVVDCLAELGYQHPMLVQIVTDVSRKAHAAPLEKRSIEGVKQSFLGDVNPGIVIVRVEVTSLQLGFQAGIWNKERKHLRELPSPTACSPFGTETAAIYGRAEGKRLAWHVIQTITEPMVVVRQNNASTAAGQVALLLLVTIPEVHRQARQRGISSLQHPVHPARPCLADTVLLPRKGEQIDRKEKVPISEGGSNKPQIASLLVLHTAAFAKSTGEHPPIIV